MVLPHRFRKIARLAYERPPLARRMTRGQSFVELALVLPLILIMALAVFDFARVLTASITIESAAREAADYGGLYPWHWNNAVPGTYEKTAEEMTTRACTAASTLTDYEGDDPDVVAAGDPVTCTNPTVAYDVVNATGYSNCYDVPRTAVPCRVVVTVVFDFETIVPLSLQVGDARIGLPSSVTLTRTSTFAVSNFELDEGLAP